MVGFHDSHAFSTYSHLVVKKRVKAQPFTNKDEISDKRDKKAESYLKGLGLISTLLGATALGDNNSNNGSCYNRSC